MFTEDCPTDIELEEYAFRRESMPDSKREEIKLHVEDCPDCMDTLSAYLYLGSPQFAKSLDDIFKRTYSPQELPEELVGKLQRGTEIKLRASRRKSPKWSYLDRFSFKTSYLDRPDALEMAADSSKPDEVKFPVDIESEDGNFTGTLDFDVIEDRLILTLQDQRPVDKGEGPDLLVRIPEREIEKTVKLKDGKAQVIFEMVEVPDIIASSIEISVKGVR